MDPKWIKPSAKIHAGTSLGLISVLIWIGHFAYTLVPLGDLIEPTHLLVLLLVYVKEQSGTPTCTIHCPVDYFAAFLPGCQNPLASCGNLPSILTPQQNNLKTIIKKDFTLGDVTARKKHVPLALTQILNAIVVIVGTKGKERFRRPLRKGSKIRPDRRWPLAAWLGKF